MTDTRSALDKHLGISDQDHVLMPFDRHRALVEHVGQALTAQNYAAAQVYALLIIAERQDAGRIDVHLTDWEDLAIAISANMAPDLQRITEAIDRLDR